MHTIIPRADVPCAPKGNLAAVREPLKRASGGFIAPSVTCSLIEELLRVSENAVSWLGSRKVVNLGLCGNQTARSRFDGQVQPGGVPCRAL